MPGFFVGKGVGVGACSRLARCRSPGACSAHTRLLTGFGLGVGFGAGWGFGGASCVCCVWARTRRCASACAMRSLTQLAAPPGTPINRWGLGAGATRRVQQAAHARRAAASCLALTRPLPALYPARRRRGPWVWTRMGVGHCACARTRPYAARDSHAHAALPVTHAGLGLQNHRHQAKVPTQGREPVGERHCSGGVGDERLVARCRSQAGRYRRKMTTPFHVTDS